MEGPVYVDIFMFGDYLLGVVAGVFAIEVLGPLYVKFQGREWADEMFSKWKTLFVSSVGFLMFSAVALDLDQLSEDKRWGYVAIAIIAADMVIISLKGVVNRLFSKFQ